MIAINTWYWYIALSICLIFILYYLSSLLFEPCIDYLSAYLHYRTARLKVQRRPKRIILIRHGESQGNEDKNIYEHTPDNKIELTNTGIQQALKAGEDLKSIIGDETVLFYVSPFKRAKQTFDLMSKSFQKDQYKVREDPRIREQEWGNFQQADNMKQILMERDKVGRFFYRFQNGESGSDVFDRVSSFMESLFRELANDSPAQNICIVSHGLFMRLFLMRFFRWSVETFEFLLNFDNCGYCVLEQDKPYGSYRLITKLKVDPDSYREAMGASPPHDANSQFVPVQTNRAQNSFALSPPILLKVTSTDSESMTKAKIKHLAEKTPRQSVMREPDDLQIILDSLKHNQAPEPASIVIDERLSALTPKEEEFDNSFCPSLLNTDLINAAPRKSFLAVPSNSNGKMNQKSRSALFRHSLFGKAT